MITHAAHAFVKPASKLSIYERSTRVSFRVLLSRDFSRLPQMESLLAG